MIFRGTALKSSRASVWFSVLVVVALIGFIAWMCVVDWTSANYLVRETKRALIVGDLKRAEELALRLARRSGQQNVGNLYAGEAAAKAGRPQEAIAYYARVPDDGSPPSTQALLATGDLMLNTLYNLSAAESAYQQILRRHPEDLAAHYRMSYVLGLQGRSWEASQHRLELVRGERAEPVQLVLLALADTAEENFHLVDDYARAQPDDPRVLCARAWIHLRREQLDAARTLLQRAVAVEPELLTAQGWLGRTLLEKPDAEFLAWQERLPPAADQHPEIWYTRGRWAQAHAQLEVAARCFWEAVRTDPEHTSANFHLSVVLDSLGQSAPAEVFRQRAKRLGDYTIAGKSFQLSGDRTSLQTAARLAKELGLLWEAWGWTQLLNQRVPGQSRVVDSMKRLRSQLDQLSGQELTRSNPAQNPARQIDLQAYPAKVQKVSASNTHRTVTHSAESSRVTFADLAESTGLKFQYRNGSQGQSAGNYMYEISGGGVAVLDYDGNGWPDIYLTQGTDWPPRADQREYLDRLYRNLGNGQFEEVSTAARLFENSFSQGPVMGDFDQDGFPDLYVANIGVNRMFHNNGDGTFTDVTSQSGTPGDGWSMSGVLADLNGDSLPDLYVVNYLSGSDLFERACLKDGTLRTCSPHEFSAAQDRFFLNLGDGRFADRTSEAGLVVPDGKGMGIVAADFDGTGRLSLFVANDAVPNFFFVNETASRGGEPHFAERGYASGLAVDADGRAQACMGVAADDANGDGLVDLFVTNFRGESKTLYLNQSQLTFTDDTRRTGLREASLDMLGFGTQFLDGELDGYPDLVVTNGHIGDLRASGIPFQMRPQYFRNHGQAQFVELPAATLGPFFQEKHLGRGLARLDWNRDGRDDFVVSHLTTPVALVTNQTESAGHFVAIQLRGVTSERDAIGTRVWVTSGSQKWCRQLTAGDGYQASNQRQLVFGLGQSTQIDRVEVHWPAGTTQDLGPLQVDREYLLIEGRQQPVPLSH